MTLLRSLSGALSLCAMAAGFICQPVRFTTQRLARPLVAILIMLLPALLVSVNADASKLKVGTLAGKVTDAVTGEPVAYVYMHFHEIQRSATSDRQGRFQINNIPAGTYTLILHRIGYTDQFQPIIVTPGHSEDLEIRMQPSVLTGDAIEIVGLHEASRGSRLVDASTAVTGLDLRRNLDATLSGTIAGKPGIAQRSMGAAPTRPVIRGLGDVRLLILQDGERTGDVSHTTADHAVTIDPVSAEEIEIARGPTALAYGSNAIGGVVNVVRNQIPSSRPLSAHGAASMQASSVNNGMAVSGRVQTPWRDHFVVNLDVSGRLGQDYATPVGTIENSFFQTAGSSAALTYIQPWGYSGIALSSYLSRYGIPPDPTGGHPDGVDIEMARFQVESRSEVLFRDRSISMLEMQLSYRYYNHKEFETPVIIGTEYTANTVNLTFKGHYKGPGRLDGGIIGIWTEFQDYFIFDRFNLDANSYSAALFAIQEAETGPFNLKAAVRLEANAAQPRRERVSRMIGPIRQRSFIGLASSISASYDPGNGLAIGTSYMHSFRPPSLDELFSEGPHIAAYSFELGNPDLKPERGLGLDVFLRYKTTRGRLEGAVYHNWFSNYIYTQNTGRENHLFPGLNDYQFVGADARIYGVEVSGEYQLHRNFLLDAMAGYTRGERKVTPEEALLNSGQGSVTPLPMIPPLQSSLGLTFVHHRWHTGMRMRYSTTQDRLGEFETKTDEFFLLDATVQYHTTGGGLLHTFTFKVENILDSEYYNHLSRIKELFPEPGRNFSLLYRVYF